MNLVNKKLELSLVGVGFNFSTIKEGGCSWKFQDFPDEFSFLNKTHAIEAAADQAGQFLEDAGIYPIEKWRELVLKDKATMLRLHAHQFQIKTSGPK